VEVPRCHCSHTQRQEGRPTCRKPGRKRLRWLGWHRVRSVREASNSAGCSERRTDSPEMTSPRGADWWDHQECRAGDRTAKVRVVGTGTGRVRPTSSSGSQKTTCREGMSSESAEPLAGRRGAPRPAKASRISRSAAKSRCACEWGGWGREALMGRDRITRTEARASGVEQKRLLEWWCPTSPSPQTLSWGPFQGDRGHEGWTQTEVNDGYAGSRLDRRSRREGAT
jgi:hypothetical protein